MLLEPGFCAALLFLGVSVKTVVIYFLFRVEGFWGLSVWVW